MLIGGMKRCGGGEMEQQWKGGTTARRWEEVGMEDGAVGWRVVDGWERCEVGRSVKWKRGEVGACKWSSGKEGNGGGGVADWGW